MDEGIAKEGGGEGGERRFKREKTGGERGGKKDREER